MERGIEGGYQFLDAMIGVDACSMMNRAMEHMEVLKVNDKEKFFVYMDKVGNTVSSTIPIALTEAIKQDRLHGNVLLAGFGVGLSWGATIIRCI